MQVRDFFDYWDNLCKSNPKLHDREIKMTLSVSEFELHLRKAYSAGRYSAPVREPSIFEKIFGK
jgi:hypothetical protein